VIGTQLGSYEILEEIGRGGMGRVYKALQPSLNRVVAVKVLLPQLAADETFVTRFMREARSIATLEHPGIVTIYDVGESEGTYYFAMQLLDGKPLDDILDEGKPLPVEQAVNITRQMARALKYAHANGILHRDVKPGNIIVTESGGAVLTDFGIAQAASDTRLTKTGTSIGSPEYMAPEQIEGKPLDLRADLYSLGIVFFQMLTGEVPYKGDSAVSIVYQHVKAPVPSARELVPWIPESIDTIARTMMAKDPDERYPSADALLAALDDEAAGPVAKAKKPKTGGGARWAWAAAAAAVLALAGFLFLGPVEFPWEEPAPSAERVTADSAPEEEEADEPAAPEPEAEEPTVAETPEPAVDAVATTAETVPEEPATPSPPEPVPIAITSAPAGATVVLDGTPLETPTPARVELLSETEYRLQVRLEGYEGAGWTFTLADLSDAQRRSGELHFPLRSSIPPGALEIVATYPVRVQVGGRSHDSSRIELPPGDYTIQISAPTVFYSEIREVSIASGQTQEVALPASTRINIAANPSRCRVKINGQDAGYVPAEVDLTLGQHVFEFDWESLGESLTLTRNITRQTERVFAAAPR
jgi:hypothetical protein